MEKELVTMHREYFAVELVALLLRPCLQDNRITVRTEPEFELDIVHHTGIEHQAANIMSRLSTSRTRKTKLDD